jgi:hypothetical protein
MFGAMNKPTFLELFSIILISIIYVYLIFWCTKETLFFVAISRKSRISFRFILNFNQRMLSLFLKLHLSGLFLQLKIKACFEFQLKILLSK